MAEARREVWYGADGSGLIRSQRIRSTFFTDAQRVAWESGLHPAQVDSLEPSLDLFAAGCLPGPRVQLARFRGRAEGVAKILDRTRRLNLHGIHQLIGEALVPSELRELFFGLASDLPDAEIIQSAQDQLGRTGIAIARVEHLHRHELIFEPNSLELLGHRQVLIDPGLILSTGAFTDLSVQLDRWLAAGVITESQRDALARDDEIGDG